MASSVWCLAKFIDLFNVHNPDLRHCTNTKSTVLFVFNFDDDYYDCYNLTMLLLLLTKDEPCSHAV